MNVPGAACPSLRQAAPSSAAFSPAGVSDTKGVHPILGIGAGGAGGALRALGGGRRQLSGNMVSGGGAVMRGPGIQMFYIFYGNWSAAGSTVLRDLASSIGGTPWMNIVTTYYDTVGPASADIAFGGSAGDAYSFGRALTDANVWSVVSSALTSGRLPVTDNAVYFVLTAPDVTETSGFCSAYCGWHDVQTFGATTIKYSFVGDASTACLGSCYGGSAASPNGLKGIDGMASVIAHELAEAITDPTLNAWRDATGEENADKCAWTWGTTYATATGALANVRWGARDFLIQVRRARRRRGTVRHRRARAADDPPPPPRLAPRSKTG